MIRYIKLLMIALLGVTASLASAAEGEKAHETSIRTLLVPANEAVISSQLAGRIVDMRDTVGVSFLRDEILVRFDCNELNARLKVAEAEQESADLTLKAKQELFKLLSAGETEVALAAAAASKARAQTLLQKVLIGSCEIRAPFEGSITKVSARAFQSVNQGQALLEIISRKPPMARMNIPSRWLSWLKPGAVFKLSVDETGRSYSGRVSLISARIDAVSQTVEVEGEIEAAGGLVAGMSGYAAFRQRGKQR